MDHNKIAIINDLMTNYRYVVDSTHCYIHAYDSKGNLIWVFYTCWGSKHFQDNILPIEIRSINLIGISSGGNIKTRPSESELEITWDNCWGYIDTKNGQFRPSGCD